MTGETIGRYTILETLGKGSMGVVYRAHDPLIDREVALKTLRLDLDSEVTEEFRERFYREAKAAGRLSHPVIVTVHDVGEDPDSGLVYIAMELIRGSNLHDLMRSGTRFRPSEVARIVAAVAQGLEYAHNLGVVHRDIKPANILLTDDGAVKITDFGVARLESSNLTVEGQFIGTPNYMSPEQVTAESVDGRSDIFSLGVVLFQLLTGQRPFPGDTMAQVTHKIVQEPPPIPSKISPSVPPALNPIVLKCLEKDPEQRFQSAGRLAEILVTLARSLKQREPQSSADTRVIEPNLETRVETRVFDPPAEETPQQSEKTPSGAQTVLQDEAPKEEGSQAKPAKEPAEADEVPFWKWPVNPGWVVKIVGGWLALWAVVIIWLVLRLPAPPDPSPTAAMIATLHRTGEALQQARDALNAGNALKATQLARRVIDQAPASPAAREIIAAARSKIAEIQTSQAIREKVDALVDEGRGLYGQGRYREAKERFEAALDLDSQDEMASNFLELSEERLRASQQRARHAARRRAAPTPTPRRTRRVAPTPTPGTARITLFFASPISSGSITVTVGGETLGVEPFNFTTKGLFGRRKPGTGTVKKPYLIPAGRQTIGVQLVGNERGALGYESFDKSFPTNSEWTLRVDMPDPDATPRFYLVQAGR